MSPQYEPQTGKQSESPLTMDRKRPFLVTEADHGEGKRGWPLQGEAYGDKGQHGENSQGSGTQGDDVLRDSTQTEDIQGENHQGALTPAKHTHAEHVEHTRVDNKLHDFNQSESTQNASYKNGSYSSNSHEHKSSSFPPSTAHPQSNPASSTSQARNISTSSPRNPPVSSTLKAHNNSMASSTTPVRTLSKPTTKTPPKEPETLNPRLLKRSPAQHDTRLKLIKALHEQYVRLNSELKKDATDKESRDLVLSDQDLIVRVLDEEEEIAVKKFPIYGNAIRNKIMVYKRMKLPQWKEERMASTKAGSAQASTAASDPPKPIITGLTTPQEVDYVRRLVWPFEGLSKYGYVASIPSPEDVEKARASVEASGNVEVCDRCTRRFQVFPGRREEDGALASNGNCTYHPGKIYYTERGPGKNAQGQKKYRCCHQNVNDDSAGCTTAPTHVFKTTDVNRLASLHNFAVTPPNPDVPADRAICFDCEMGYTVYGLELIRMTAVSWPDYKTLVDILVQPFGEVLDLNTRYSGVTAEDMVSAERWVPGEDHRPVTTQSDQQKPKLKIASDPHAARNLLFSLIAPETPLIGHGLENDLNAVRIIHPTCIDTILLYPHRRGLPHRNGLKYLMDSLLNQKIQQEADEGAPEGHDSAEDARAAGELVRLKVRDDWKELQMKGWTIQDDKVVPPEQEWSVVGGAKGKKRGF